MEKTVKHFCTTANRIQKNTVQFLKNVDWKKVAVGVGVTAAVAGCLVLSGGAAAPVLIGAAVGAGSGAAISGGITAIGGGSIADVAKSASDGFMWGAVGGAASGGIASLLSNAVKSGSKAAASAAVQKGLDIATDTAMDIAQNVSHGEKLTLASVAGSLAFNIITAGNGNGSAKSAGNAIADSAEDGVRREVKDSLGDSVSREAKDSLSDSVSKTGRWDMTEGGGVINGREYSQHALERMAPDTPQVRAELSRRAEKRVERLGYEVGTKEYYREYVKHIDPRNIPPSVIEDAIASTKAVPGDVPDTLAHETADVKVIINYSGKVVTVIPK